MTNKDRDIRAAYSALAHHYQDCSAVALGQPNSEANIIALLKNLMLWNDDYSYDFERLLQSARDHYEAETGIVTP